MTKRSTSFQSRTPLLEYSYRDSIYVVWYLEMKQSAEIIFLSVITFKILAWVLEVHIHKFYLYYRLSINKGASISEILSTLVLSTISAHASLIIYESQKWLIQSEPTLYIHFWVVSKEKAFWTFLILFLVINDRRVGNLLWDGPPSYNREASPMKYHQHFCPNKNWIVLTIVDSRWNKLHRAHTYLNSYDLLQKIKN